MEIRTDAGASGGRYVSSPSRDEGAVRIGPFLLDGGTYVIDACAAALGPSPFASDSMYVVAESVGERYYWDFFEDEDFRPTTFECEVISARCDGSFEQHNCKPVKFELEAGQHTFTFETIEPNFGLDRIIVRAVDGS